MANVSQSPRLSHSKNIILPSLVLRLDPSGVVSPAKPVQHPYRTEIYLQQREQHRSSSNVTTWKDLMQQKQSLQHDQAEIDRALSTMDSIHGSLNRSLIVPYDRVYARLYGNGDEEDESTRLMTSFCQRQDHCRHFYLLSTSITASDEFNLNQHPKKQCYDSAYGSMLVKRRLRREPITTFAQSVVIK